MNTRETVAALAAALQPMDDGYDPASEEELLIAEAALGVTLPELFREIQKAYGRCRFAGEALILLPGAEPMTVATLFGCKGVSGNLLLAMQASPVAKTAGLVPIADDTRNNHYAWDCVKDQVFFLDYTTREPPQSVALSFEDFLNKIWIGPSR